VSVFFRVSSLELYLFELLNSDFLSLCCLTVAAVAHSQHFEPLVCSLQFKADPFPPIGCAVTAAILTGGLRSFARGESKNSQKWMRARVAAQFVTIAVIGVGFVVNQQRKPPNLREARLN
jgi:Hypoxia induced protein conserved region